MCSDLPLPYRADAPVQLGTKTKLGSVIRARFQVQLQWHLNCAHVLVQITKQKGTFSFLLTPQNLKMCLYSLAPPTGTLHKLVFMYVQMKVFLYEKQQNSFLQIAHLVDMIILLFNNNELLLFL